MNRRDFIKGSATAALTATTSLTPFFGIKSARADPATVFAAMQMAGKVANMIGNSANVNWGRANHQVLLNISNQLKGLNKGMRDSLKGINQIQNMLHTGFTEAKQKEQKKYRNAVVSETLTYYRTVRRLQKKHPITYQDYINSPQARRQLPPGNIDKNNSDYDEYNRHHDEIFKPLIRIINDTENYVVNPLEEFNVITVALGVMPLIALKSDLGRSISNIQATLEGFSDYFSRVVDPKNKKSVYSQLKKDKADLMRLEGMLKTQFELASNEKFGGKVPIVFVGTRRSQGGASIKYHYKKFFLKEDFFNANDDEFKKLSFKTSTFGRVFPRTGSRVMSNLAVQYYYKTAKQIPGTVLWRQMKCNVDKDGDLQKRRETFEKTIHGKASPLIPDLPLKNVPSNKRIFASQQVMDRMVSRDIEMLNFLRASVAFREKTLEIAKVSQSHIQNAMKTLEL